MRLVILNFLLLVHGCLTSSFSASYLGGSLTHNNPLFRQTLKKEGASISMRHSGDFLYTDHSVDGPHSKLCTNHSHSDHHSDGLHHHVPTHHELLEKNHNLVDSVKILKSYWFYEQRYYYQHSFVILETELSEFEKKHREEIGINEKQSVKYYVTEKNDLGVIWNAFYNWDQAKNLKTEHNGYQWRRENVNLYKEESYQNKKGKKKIVTIKELKLHANH